MADDPDEELFAGVAVEEAAMVGFCALEADALMSTWVLAEVAVERWALLGECG